MKYDEREKNCNLLIRNFNPTEKQQQQKTRIFQHEYQRQVKLYIYS